MTKKFFTGIYPYSMMMSSFKPVQVDQYPHALKVTTSSQEWCGHTFSQLNKEPIGYSGILRSYFESEGDQSIRINEEVWLEDEIWQLIRFDPSNLPQGDIQMIPGTMFNRLKHKSIQPSLAKVTMKELDDKYAYSIKYQNLERELTIFFEKSFPYQIVQWEERYKSGFGSDAEDLITSAKLKETIQLDYWNKHDKEDAHYREKLGISQY